MNAFTLSLYVGFALFTAFPYKSEIVATGNTPILRVIIAVLLYIISCGISYYIVRKHMGRSGPRELVKRIILVLLDIGLLLTLALVSFGIQHVISLPPVLLTIFGSSSYFFWWFVAPLVALLVI